MPSIAISVLVIVGLVLVVLFGVPLLLALVDLMLVLAVAAAGLVGRFVFRRPWTVEACSSAGSRHEVEVVGWRRAGERARSMAQEIEHGSAVGSSEPGSRT